MDSVFHKIMKSIMDHFDNCNFFNEILQKNGLQSHYEYVDGERTWLPSNKDVLTMDIFIKILNAIIYLLGFNVIITLNDELSQNNSDIRIIRRYGNQYEIVTINKTFNFSDILNIKGENFTYDVDEYPDQETIDMFSKNGIHISDTSKNFIAQKVSEKIVLEMLQKGIGKYAEAYPYMRMNASLQSSGSNLRIIKKVDPKELRFQNFEIIPVNVLYIRDGNVLYF